MTIASTKHVTIEQRQHKGRSWYSLFCMNDSGKLIEHCRFHEKRTAFRMARVFLRYGLPQVNH